MKAFHVSCFSLGALFLSSCGSIINGSKQSIGFSSSSDGAMVTIDGMPQGRTPITVKLERDKDHTVRISLPGYYPYSATLTHSVSGWVWGNILFGGLIGLAVDASTGGMYALSPEQVQTQLIAGQRYAKYESNQGNQAYLFVVLNPKSEWMKVGNLRRI